MKRIGFQPRNTEVIPISTLLGSNINKRDQLLEWFKGKTLSEALDEAEEPRIQEK